MITSIEILKKLKKKQDTTEINMIHTMNCGLAIRGGYGWKGKCLVGWIDR